MKKHIEIALGFEGWTETGGNNVNPFAEYLDSVPGFYNGAKNGFPWCDVFVDFCFVKAYGAETAKKLLCQPDNSLGAGCIYSARYFQEHGQFLTSEPEPGDQIFFGGDREVYHTGLVYEVSGRTVHTIEGNTSDGVFRRHYALADGSIYGYGRPDWSLVGEAEPSEKVNEEPPLTAEYSIMLPLIKTGSLGGYVKSAQLLLIGSGFSCGPDGADGDFGGNTERAAMRFQSAHALKADGEVGGETWAELIKGE